MKQHQAEAQAKEASKTAGAQFVVWVFDEGRAVYTREQVRWYAPLIQIECLYVDGVRVEMEAAQKLSRL